MNWKSTEARFFLKNYIRRQVYNQAMDLSHKSTHDSLNQYWADYEEGIRGSHYIWNTSNPTPKRAACLKVKLDVFVTTGSIESVIKQYLNITT
jgi:hypothetical protein